MKSFLTVLTTTLVLAAMSSCQRDRATDGPTSVSGRVVDQTTHQPVPGATVYLLQSGRGNGVTGALPTPVDPVIADAQGYYHLEFSAEKGYRYELQGKACGFLSGSLEMQPTFPVTAGQKNAVEVLLRPEGYVRVRVIAPAPKPYAMVTFENQSYIRANRIGSPIDTAVTIPMWGGQNNQVVWRIYPDGTVTSYGYSATIYCPAHDTANFTVRF